MAEESLDLSNVPGFTFDPAEIEKIRAEAGVTDLPPADQSIDIPAPARPRRKRGRPRKYNPDGSPKYPHPEDSPESGRAESSDAASPSGSFPPAPLSKRDEREVAVRLANILTGATGMASVVKPYLQMTEEEAKAIADPLSSYLVRNSDTIPVAKQILENYDLLAITLGVMAYVIRVYRDRSNEIAEQRKLAGPAAKTLSRLEQLTESSDIGPEDGATHIVGFPTV